MPSDGGEGGQEGAQWALRFISGKYQGGEFPLRPNREIIIGRSSDLDMVLVEDMVSRKHAKITTDDDGGHIQDLGSTNGTFVNGEKVRKADLKDGDRILIGTSIIKLVSVDGEQTSHRQRDRGAVEDGGRRRTSARRRAQADVGQHRGDPAARSAAAAVDQPQVGRAGRSLGPRRRARSSCARGRSTSPPSTTSSTSARARRMFRMLTWTQGTFELEPPDETRGAGGDAGVDRGAADGGHAPARRVQRAAEKLPPLASPDRRAAPARSRSCAISSPEELDVFQSAMEVKTVNALFDASSMSDLDIALRLVTLFEKNYLVAG